jgi:hypothetical protein
MRVVAILVAAATALVLVASAGATQITRDAKTKSYSLTLVIGPSEQMYSQAELKAKLGDVYKVSVVVHGEQASFTFKAV